MADFSQDFPDLAYQYFPVQNIQASIPELIETTENQKARRARQTTPTQAKKIFIRKSERTFLTQQIRWTYTKLCKTRKNL